MVVPKGGAQVSTKVELKPAQAPFEAGATVGTATAFRERVRSGLRETCARRESVGISLARRAWSWLKAGSRDRRVHGGMLQIWNSVYKKSSPPQA